MDDGLLQKLSVGTSDEKREIIKELAQKGLTDKEAEEIVKLIDDDDSGVRDAASSALVENNNPKIPELVVPYISSHNISTRNLAGEILLKKGVSAIDAMLKYLKKGNDDDQKFLIDILGLIGDIKAEDAIIEVLKVTQNSNVILACIEALGNIKSEKAIEFIIEKYSENELYHPTIFDALGKIGSKEAIDFMVKEYQKADELTKYAMIESMGEIGNEEVFFLLLSELSKLTPPLTWVVVESIAKLHEKLNLDIPFDESMKHNLVDVINDADIQYKIAASRLLKNFSDKDIIQACLANYGIDEEFDKNVKSKFIEFPAEFYRGFLEISKTSEKDKELFDLFKEIVAVDNGASLNNLSPVEFRQLCDLFTVKLESIEEEVRLSSMELLFYLCLDTALMFLDVMVNDDSSWNKIRLLDFLDQLDGDEVMTALEQLSKDEDSMVSDRALEIINNRGKEESYNG